MDDFNNFIELLEGYSFLRNSEFLEGMEPQLITNITKEEYLKLRKDLINRVEDTNIIDTIKKKPDKTKNTIIFYYLSELYHDEFKQLLYDNGFINDGAWDLNKIQSLSDKKDLEKIYRIIEYNRKAISFIDEMNIKGFQYKERVGLENSIQIIIADHSKVYYALNDFKNFEKYAIKASEYGSIASMNYLVYYYCDKDDFNNANLYFEKCMNTNIWYDDSITSNLKVREFYKIQVCKFLYDYYYSNGMISDALAIATRVDEYLKHTKFFKDDQLFINDINNQIKDCKNLLSKEKNEIKFDILKDYFDKDVIEYMDSNIKTYVVTSISIYDYINKNNELLDYSAALMPIMKGVEYILYNIIVNKYVESLKKRSNLNYNLIIDRFKYTDRHTNKLSINNKIDRIEYGDALYSIATKEYTTGEWIINKYFYDFYYNNSHKGNSIEIITDLANRLDSLKNKRNHVAHKNRVFKDDADKYIKELISDHLNFISFIYKEFDFCFKKK